MKIFKILVLTLFTALTAYGQVVTCSLQGPGTADGGVDPVECGVIANYSFQDTDGSVCVPPDNTPSNWSWCIENLGTPGYISINQSTTYPYDGFFLTNGIEGVILGASHTSITIQWNCNDCSGDEVPHINILFGCGEEIYQSSVFVECSNSGPGPGSDCTTNKWDCVSTDCDCIKVCINGVVEILETDGAEIFFCYPEGTDIGAITSCDEDLRCRRIGDTPHQGEDSFSDTSPRADEKNYIEIPDVKIIQTNKEKGKASLSISLPDSDTAFELLISDNLGRLIHSKKMLNQHEAVVQLNNLSTGIYHILITDGNYRITQKVFVN